MKILNSPNMLSNKIDPKIVKGNIRVYGEDWGLNLYATSFPRLVNIVAKEVRDRT